MVVAGDLSALGLVDPEFGDQDLDDLSGACAFAEAKCQQRGLAVHPRRNHLDHLGGRRRRRGGAQVRVDQLALLVLAVGARSTGGSGKQAGPHH